MRPESGSFLPTFTSEVMLFWRFFHQMSSRVLTGLKTYGMWLSGEVRELTLVRKSQRILLLMRENYVYRPSCVTVVYFTVFQATSVIEQKYTFSAC